MARDPVHGRKSRAGAHLARPAGGLAGLLSLREQEPVG
ncbi:hypothetical protein SS05631_c22210 [Sinorhizobium sp. CCBAU 05631]|nr:hypothetical protein SS05631_c22210 [Sinorhizobium sp. CCBAU 05631]